MPSETVLCIVCESSLRPFFEKPFRGRWGLGNVEYWKCMCCGLTIAKTLYEMPRPAWEALNETYHRSLFELDSIVRASADYRWPMRARGIKRLHDQARVLASLSQQGLLSNRLPWIDYGCGNGVLVDQLAMHSVFAWKFDPHIHGAGYLTMEELKQPFSVVINTAVFEHIRERTVLDEIANLVAEDGVLALHTLVCETIPKDPAWFYLLPVHCTMFTNDSMQRLFEQWGFVESLYHVPSRMWFWFRQPVEATKRFMESKPPGFYMRHAFVDYWKGQAL